MTDVPIIQKAVHWLHWFNSILIGHSTTLKEKYDPIKQVMKQITDVYHYWVIYVDLKMVNFLLGQQSGYTKFPYFLCLWDSRAKDQHYVKKDWPLRTESIPGDKNLIAYPLVPRDKIIFSLLHVKLGLMKQFVEAGISIEKKKMGIFDDPDIRKLVKDPHFIESMNDVESRAWTSFKSVIQNFTKL